MPTLLNGRFKKTIMVAGLFGSMLLLLTPVIYLISLSRSQDTHFQATAT